ncbi:MAG: VCBS repeat-containing protein [Bryobacter sp.]|nr:VCBS repeat-containing protein [Bryobacter sp.]
MRRLQQFSILLLAASLFAQDYRVPPKFARSRPLDQVLQKVDARTDSWAGESAYEEVHTLLDSWAIDLKKGQARHPRLAELARGLAKVSVVQLKIVASDPSANSLATTLRVEVSGLTPTQTRLSRYESWRLLWQRDNGTWTPNSLTTSDARESTAGSLAFTDITDAALGHLPSFRQQLQPGLDHWRGLLDVATGIDVYGHQGIAVGDYDNDGHEDLYLAQPAGLPNRLYRNLGNGRFADVTQATGTGFLADTRAVLFADFDNDGDQDLLLVTASQPYLLRNTNTRFTLLPAATLPIPADRQGSFTSAAWADYDRDGLLDLYLCSYDFWQPGRTYNTPTPFYDAQNGPPNFLFRNLGNGRFADVTAAAGLNQNNNRYSFAAAWADYDNDGHPDLYVANDFGRNNLYRNLGNGKFADVAAAAGVEDLGAGMSVAWGDANQDGLLDLYVGNMWSSAGQRVTNTSQFAALAAGPARSAFQRQAKGSTLYLNLGNGQFQEDASGALEFGRWAWGSDFADLDNDGHLDVYVQNGYITGPDLHDL